MSRLLLRGLPFMRHAYGILFIISDAFPELLADVGRGQSPILTLLDGADSLAEGRLIYEFPLLIPPESRSGYLAHP